MSPVPPDYTLSTLRFAQWRYDGPRRAPLTGPAWGPPGRSSRRNPLTRGPYNLFAGGGAKIVATLMASRKS